MKVALCLSGVVGKLYTNKNFYFKFCLKYFGFMLQRIPLK